ncbi:MAG: hypothetical protein O2812_02510, partial [Chloroflexi bacterium]|nr:hypothetical protein [Chloroflexota bacterium]
MLKSLRSIAIAMVSFVLLGACVELSTSNPTATPTAEGAAAQEASPTPTATSQSLISGAVETPHTPTAFGSTRVGQPFVLDGTPSVDDRVISTFTWVQVRGPHVPLIAGDPHTPLLSVVPQQAGAYVFELVVTDNSGLISVPQTATFVVGNDPPEVRVTSPSTGIVGWNVAVQFKLADSTADLANIKVEYSVDGGHTFSPATPSAASSTGDPDRPVVIGSVPNTGGVSTNPEGSAAGAEHSFLWDTAHDLGATVQDVVVR